MALGKRRLVSFLKMSAISQFAKALLETPNPQRRRIVQKNPIDDPATPEVPTHVRSIYLIEKLPFKSTRDQAT